MSICNRVVRHRQNWPVKCSTLWLFQGGSNCLFAAFVFCGLFWIDLLTTPSRSHCRFWVSWETSMRVWCSCQRGCHWWSKCPMATTSMSNDGAWELAMHHSWQQRGTKHPHFMSNTLIQFEQLLKQWKLLLGHVRWGSGKLLNHFDEVFGCCSIQLWWTRPWRSPLWIVSILVQPRIKHKDALPTILCPMSDELAGCQKISQWSLPHWLDNDLQSICNESCAPLSTEVHDHFLFLLGIDCLKFLSWLRFRHSWCHWCCEFIANVLWRLRILGWFLRLSGSHLAQIILVFLLPDQCVLDFLDGMILEDGLSRWSLLLVCIIC